MAKITFDGIEVEVPDGTTIMNAARQIGGSIVPPAMCYYTPLKGSGGKCRACLVKVSARSARVMGFFSRTLARLLKDSIGRYWITPNVIRPPVSRMLKIASGMRIVQPRRISWS